MASFCGVRLPRRGREGVEGGKVGRIRVLRLVFETGPPRSENTKKITQRWLGRWTRSTRKRPPIRDHSALIIGGWRASRRNRFLSPTRPHHLLLRVLVCLGAPRHHGSRLPIPSTAFFRAGPPRPGRHVSPVPPLVVSRALSACGQPPNRCT